MIFAFSVSVLGQVPDNAKSEGDSVSNSIRPIMLAPKKGAADFISEDTIPRGIVLDRFPARGKASWRPSPRKATLLAIALPGAGQIYNRRLWKIPLVYAGFGVMTGLVIFNDQKYQEFRDAYILRLKGDRSPASFYDKYTRIESLSIIREGYRRNRDLSVILTGAWYAITVLDAVVDAHLFGFSVKDDLEGGVKPVGLLLPNGSLAPGIGLNLRFK